MQKPRRRWFEEGFNRSNDDSTTGSSSSSSSDTTTNSSNNGTNNEEGKKEVIEDRLTSLGVEWEGRRSGRSNGTTSSDSSLPSPSTPVRVHHPKHHAPLPSPPSSSASPSRSSPKITIVLVGGFLLPPHHDFHLAYWGAALDPFAFPPSRYNIICVHPGPIASLHDRVCQIFYELKGGRTNYGRGHSHKFGHAATEEDEEEGEGGREGLFPEWSAEHPVHLVGHSFGGMTVRLLLHYLEKKAFLGYEDTSPEWVRSVTTINTPHNGTHLVYGLGADPAHPPVVHWGSPGYMLGVMAHVLEFMDMKAVRAWGLDFKLGCWRLSWRKGLWRGLGRVGAAVLGACSL